MKYDKTSLIGVALCVVLLLLWGPLTRRLIVSPTPGPVSTADSGPVPANPAPVETEQPLSSPADPAVPQAAVSPSVPLTRDLLADPETPRPEPQLPPVYLSVPEQFRAGIDPAGGGITEVSLDTYYTSRDRQGEQLPVRLGLYQYPFCSVDLAPLGGSSRPAETLSADASHLCLSREIFAGTAVLTEEWRTDPERPYQIFYSVGVTNRSENAVDLGTLAIDAGALPPSVSPGEEAGGTGIGSGGVTVAFNEKDRPQTFSVKEAAKFHANPEKGEFLRSSSVKWLAVHSKYFLFYMAGADEQSFTGCTVDAIAFTPDGSIKAPGKNDRAWFRGELFVAGGKLKPGERKEWTFRCYAGPMKFQFLRDIGGQLDAVMDMDRFFFFHPRWMGFLSRQILYALTWLNRVFDCTWGYGYAILILTLVVKVLFWPLTHKSTQSMRKMQKLQPELKALREKYKEDPQKLYRKQMELYKEKNVSQFGGCLPIVLQIPVFFALFNTFRSAIELRQASFLWAADLSLPDTLDFSPGGLPIRPFALLMGATMVGQQKLMPTGDPSQARMMMFMSIFFIFLFYRMPSALTLYWSMSQILTIAQSLITRRLEQKEGT